MKKQKKKQSAVEITMDELITSRYDVKEDVSNGEIVNWSVSGFAYSQGSNSYYKIILKNIQLEE